MSKIGFVEIPTRDLKAACEFYRKLFGWQCGIAHDMNYGFFYTGQGIGGGFSPNDEPGKGVIFYVETPDIDGVLKRAVELGGEIAMQKTKVGDKHGFIGRFKDLSGNTVGLWSKT